MRLYSIDSAGYVEKNTFNAKFTHREKYVGLPSLRKRGWVTENNKLVAVHKILEKEYGKDESNYIYTKIHKNSLTSVKTLKDTIFSLVERYIMKGKYISESKGMRTYDPRSNGFVRERITKRMGTPYETLSVIQRQYFSDDPDLYKNFCRKHEKRVYNIFCKKLKHLPKYEIDSLFPDYLQEMFLSFKSRQPNCVKKTKKYYMSRISHSMLAQWGYKDWEISRRRSAKINAYSPRETIVVDPYMEENPDGSNAYFFSKHHKKFLKFMPTKVMCESGGIFYYSPYSGKSLLNKKNRAKTQKMDPIRKIEIRYLSYDGRSLFDVSSSKPYYKHSYGTIFHDHKDHIIIDNVFNRRLSRDRKTEPNLCLFWDNRRIDSTHTEKEYNEYGYSPYSLYNTKNNREYSKVGYFTAQPDQQP